MSGRKSRSKGAKGENDVAKILKGYGFEASRNRIGVTAQDILHDVPGVHIEVKRAERLELPAWLRQAERDAPDGHAPAVVFRKNSEPWRIVVPLNHYLDLQYDLRQHRKHHRNDAC